MSTHPTETILTDEQLSAKRLGKPNQIEYLERESQEINWALHGRSQYDGEAISFVPQTEANPDHLRQCLVKNEQTLEDIRPPVGLSQSLLKQYRTKERELREKVTSGMPSYEMMRRPTDENVQWTLAWNQHYAKDAVALMNVREILRANLDPTNRDPFLTSIETLRPVQPPKIDPRRYNRMWEELRFTDEVERQLADPGDVIYGKFLRYKALEWADKTIMRELELSQEAFEACLDRLAQDRVQAQAMEDEWPTGEVAPSPPLAEPTPPTGGASPAHHLPLRFTGAELKEAMAAKGMTQNTLATRIGMSKNTLASKIQERASFKDDERFRILAALSDEVPSNGHVDTEERTTPPERLEAAFAYAQAHSGDGVVTEEQQ